MIVVHDPTVVRNGNGTTSTGTSSNVNGTFSKRYQDIIREDATVPDDTAALKGYTIGNGNEVCYVYYGPKLEVDVQFWFVFTFW